MSSQSTQWIWGLRIQMDRPMDRLNPSTVCYFLARREYYKLFASMKSNTEYTHELDQMSAEMRHEVIWFPPHLQNTFVLNYRKGQTTTFKIVDVENLMKKGLERVTIIFSGRLYDTNGWYCWTHHNKISWMSIKSSIFGIILEGNCITNWFTYNFAPYFAVSYLMFHMCTHVHTYL